MTKTQQPATPGGMFTKDRFDINLEQDCHLPHREHHPHPVRGDGAGKAGFGMPAAPAHSPTVHHRRRRMWHHHRPAEAAHRRPGPSARPGVDGRLPGHPTQSGTQNRPPVRRRHRGRRARVRGSPSRRRFRPPRRRGQPRTARRARRASTPDEEGHRADQTSARRIPYTAAETLTTTPRSPAETQKSITARRAHHRHRHRLIAVPAPAAVPPIAVRHQPPSGLPPTTTPNCHANFAQLIGGRREGFGTKKSRVRASLRQ